jgi:adenosylhomocysteinase
MPPGDVAAGEARIAWADGQMPVLRQVRERLAQERPLEGVRIAACLHITAETANLALALLAGGAEVGLCPANPLTTQDEVVAALAGRPGARVIGERGEGPAALAAHLSALVDSRPHITIDDGADLVVAVHAQGGEALKALRGGTEETTTGLVRLRALAAEGGLHRPVLAVNESFTERAFNDRYGTGQSALDGILRATNLLLAGRTLVVLGYGPAGQGVAQRARGAGAIVIVCEVEPLRALEAAMEGYMVLPALRAAELGDVFVTVTGGRGALSSEHFAAMKDGAVLANAGHFDVEIDLPALEAAATGGRREVLPLVDEYDLGGGRRLNLLARGRVVNLAAAQGHPAAVMDMSFAGQALAVAYLVREGASIPAGVQAVPPAIDREVARLKLESLGVEIDALSEAQREYLRRWEG